MLKPLITGCVTGLLTLVSAAIVGHETRAAAAEPPGGYPSVRLSNRVVEMELYLPDAVNGYYHSTRFDWSGLIARVRYAGHTFYAPWQSPHDPAVTDAAIGPTEEFGMQSPPGYEEAKPGESFLKIGVGALQRHDADPYKFWIPYTILKPGDWQVTHGPTWIQFEQTFHGDRGWAYRYTKRIELVGQTASFVIQHHLKNIGSKTIDTTIYCHNFTIIDDEPIGPSYRITVPFDLVAKHPQSPPAVIEGRTILHTEPIPAGKPTYFEFRGVPSTASANNILIENRRTGAAIHITGSEPLVDFHFYGADTAICPEPFTAVKVLPEAEQSWQSRYTLSLGAR